MEDLIYSYWLANISGIGTKTIHQLYKYCGSAKAVWHLSGSEEALWDHGGGCRAHQPVQNKMGSG